MATRPLIASAVAAGKISKRRRRQSSGDGDDSLLDEMLEELGIPTSEEKRKKKKKKHGGREEGTDQRESVIELLTPPHPPPQRTERASEHVAIRADSTGGDMLDLTTPTPPSGSSSRRHRKRVSIVNLLSSPETPEKEPETEREDEKEEKEQEDEWEEPDNDLYSWSPPPLPTESEKDDEDEDEDEDDGDEETRLLHAVMSGGMPPQSRARPLYPEFLRQDDGESENNTTSTLASASPERLAAYGRAAAASRGSSHKSPQRSQQKQPTAKAFKRTAKPKAPPKPAKQVVFAAIAMEKSISESSVGAAIQKALETNTYNNKNVPFRLEPCFDNGLRVIQWQRQGGICNASQSSSSSRHAIALYFPADQFLSLLLERGYDALLGITKRLLETPPKWGQPQADRAPIPIWGYAMLVIEGMDKALIHRKKQLKKKKTTTTANEMQQPITITFSDLHELAFRLFVDTSIHTKFTCDTDATASSIALVTRELLVAASWQQTPQEEFLESVPRNHSFRVSTRDASTGNAFANTWLRMLQMVPSVSEDRAQQLLNHFPTFSTLFRAFTDPRKSDQDKKELLADKLTSTRYESTLSRKIYHVFSSWNENQTV